MLLRLQARDLTIAILPRVMTNKISFVDTNLFLHFPALDQIDWLDLLRCDYAVIIVTATVIRELNRHKDAPVSLKLRERAASSLKKLYTYSELSAPIVVRDSVELQFNTREPLLNFASEGLSKEISDDFLMATILEFKRNSPEANVVLMTDDLGLKLKAGTHEINVVRPPEQLRLPDELDPNQKRVRELEEKVRLLQLQIPDMKLVFESQEDRFRFTLKPEVALSPKTVNWRVSRLRKKFSKLRKPQWFSSADLQTGAIPPAAYDLYNQGLDLFFAEYETYFRQLQSYFNQRRRVIDLRIWALNQGTCPAKDIHIFMHFPDGFGLLSKSELPERPKPPQAPEKPKSRNESLSAGVLTNLVSNVNLLKGDEYPGNLNFPSPAANVRLLSIKRTKSYEVKMHVGETKHNFLTPLDPVYVVFDSHEHARSFSVEYEIYCGNAPERQIGRIHVIIERLTGTTVFSTSKEIR